ncbi:MAG: response regulator transcription factor [Ferruginibacter sp.]
MPHPSPLITLIIADDHELVRKGMQDTLQPFPDISILKLVNSGEELIERTHELRPDIVITDIRMGVLSGLEAAKIIRAKLPATGLIALSGNEEEHLVMEMLHTGFDGILLKSSDSSEILAAIKEVYVGHTYYCKSTTDVVNELIRKRMYNAKKRKVRRLLTEREEGIVKMICKGLSSKDISIELDLSVRTIESHRENIFRKTGCENLAALVIYVVTNGYND